MEQHTKQTPAISIHELAHQVELLNAQQEHFVWMENPYGRLLRMLFSVVFVRQKEEGLAFLKEFIDFAHSFGGLKIDVALLEKWFRFWCREKSVFTRLSDALTDFKGHTLSENVWREVFYYHLCFSAKNPKYLMHQMLFSAILKAAKIKRIDLSSSPLKAIRGLRFSEQTFKHLISPSAKRKAQRKVIGKLPDLFLMYSEKNVSSDEMTTLLQRYLYHFSPAFDWKDQPGADDFYLLLASQVHPSFMTNIGHAELEGLKLIQECNSIVFSDFTFKGPELVVTQGWVDFLFRHFHVPFFIKTLIFSGSKEDKQWCAQMISGLSLRKAQGKPYAISKRMVKILSDLRLPLSANVDTYVLTAKLISLQVPMELAIEMATYNGATANYNAFVYHMANLYRRYLYDDQTWFTLTVWNYILHLMATGQRVPDTKTCNLSALWDEAEYFRMVVYQATKKQNRLSIPKKLPYLGVADFNMITDQGLFVSINQITTPMSLEKEGRILKHCVYKYLPELIDGFSYIFSLKIGSNHVLTIEVSGCRHIEQVRGFENRDPSSTEWAWVAHWARINRLELSYAIEAA